MTEDYNKSKNKEVNYCDIENKENISPENMSSCKKSEKDISIIYDKLDNLTNKMNT